MTIHLEPERIIFTIVGFLGLFAQLIYFYMAFVHARKLDDMKIIGDLREQIGPHWEQEWGFLYVMVVAAALGTISFTAPVAPRTVFSIVATVTVTGIVLVVQICAFKTFSRRAKVVNGRQKKKKLERATH